MGGSVLILVNVLLSPVDMSSWEFYEYHRSSSLHRLFWSCNNQGLYWNFSVPCVCVLTRAADSEKLAEWTFDGGPEQGAKAWLLTSEKLLLLIISLVYQSLSEHQEVFWWPKGFEFTFMFLTMSHWLKERRDASLVILTCHHKTDTNNKNDICPPICAINTLPVWFQ